MRYLHSKYSQMDLDLEKKDNLVSEKTHKYRNELTNSKYLNLTRIEYVVGIDVIIL